MTLIRDNPRVAMNHIRVKPHGKAVKILSNLAASLVLDRGKQEDFSFSSMGFVVLKNILEEPQVVDLTVLKSPAGLIARSSRGGAREMQADDTLTFNFSMAPGEAFTFTSTDHETPQGKLSL